MFARAHQSRCSYWVYILTNKPHGTLYVGVTNSLERRVAQHRDSEGARVSFVHRYGLGRLVYFEDFSDVRDAIAREKQLKGWLRSKKIELIRQANPLWQDLADGWRTNPPVDSSLRSE
jgi:putative endonuclease